jgi:hypothetical protein
MSSPVDRAKVVPRWLMSLLLVAGGLGWSVAVLSWLSEPGALQDFVEYWAAGRLNARGENPYDPVGLYGQEKEVSPELTNAIMMWNPPWTLSLAMPFGLLPARPAHVLWLLLQLAIVLGCVDRLWDLYGGPQRYRWVAWLVGLCFVPTLFLLRLGQISAVILLGVTSFLHFGKQGRWGWAGAAIALAAVKPQLVYLLAMGLIVWALQQRRWRIFLGGGLTLFGLTAAPLACNPAVVKQYLDAMTHQPPQMLSPTVGALLRLAAGPEHLWLQFVPMGFGVAWFCVHWLRHGRGWEWEAQMPLILMVSFLTTSYGAWSFDLVVLLIPITQAAVWIVKSGSPSMTRFALTALAGFDAMALLTMNVHWSEQYWHVWMTPMILFAYLVLRRHESTVAHGIAFA